MHKSELRQHVRMMKRQFTAAQLRELSKPIVRRLLVHPRLKSAQTILMYCSLDDEVDTHGVLDQLVVAGKTVLLPVVVSETEMELRRYTCPEDLQSGFFNILEPIGEVFTDYAQIDLAVIPGMSFDRRGNRLGRGKGYYDRLLPLLTNAYKLGICFDFQRLPGIPTEATDVVMDELV